MQHAEVKVSIIITDLFSADSFFDTELALRLAGQQQAFGNLPVILHLVQCC